MISIKRFEHSDIDDVMAFEKELRRQEPNTFYWKPDEKYQNALESSFADARFCNAASLLAWKDKNVIGRIDASVICSRSDAACFSAYLDWICVLKSERHHSAAQQLLEALRKELKAQGVGMLIGLMAGNEEAQRFYRHVDGASIHDTGIGIEIK